MRTFIFEQILNTRRCREWPADRIRKKMKGRLKVTAEDIYSEIDEEEDALWILLQLLPKDDIKVLLNWLNKEYSINKIKSIERLPTDISILGEEVYFFIDDIMTQDCYEGQYSSILKDILEKIVSIHNEV